MAWLPALSIPPPPLPKFARWASETGKAVGGFFGNTNNGIKLFDVAATNSTGEGGQLFDFLGNGDGSFAAPTFNSVPYPIVNDGLNVVIAGPVFSPSSRGFGGH